jgi:hypothetical protein
VLIDEDTIPELGVFATNQKLRNSKHNANDNPRNRGDPGSEMRLGPLGAFGGADSMIHQLKAKADADATRNANEQLQVSLRVGTIIYYP